MPQGFLHGFVTLTPRTDVLYKIDAFYSGEHDGPDLGIDWSIDLVKAVLSDKDTSTPMLKDWERPFVWEDA